VRDLGSANGTTVDGVRLGEEPFPVSNGSMIGLASHRYHFLEGPGA
jgi:hypothetical protein